MRQTFPREERLKSRKIIQDLFRNGRKVNAFPLRILWCETELPEAVCVQFGTSVPKRTFPKAVDRNRVRRKIREAVRLNKHTLQAIVEENEMQLAVMVLYLGKSVPEYASVDAKISEAFERLIEAL